MQTLINNEIDYRIPGFVSETATHSEGASILPAMTGLWPKLDIVAEGVALLDRCYSLMFEGRIGEAMDRLIPGLASLRFEYGDVADDWRYFAQTVCRQHPIAEVLQHDPITREATKGHAGRPIAADMLDLICGIDETGEDVSRLGTAIYTSTCNLPSARSLRARRDILAKRIEETMARVEGARILAIGCGHLREAQIVDNLAAANVDAFVAVDGNDAALDVVNNEQPSVEVLHASIRNLMMQAGDFYDFDLVYAPNAFDNLSDDEAHRLMELMFSMLRPSGRVIVATFSGEWLDAGYREAYLNWTVIPRTEAEVVALTKGIPSKMVGQVRLYTDEGQHSNFIELYRK